MNKLFIDIKKKIEPILKKTKPFFMRLSLKEKITFIKQLSILIRAGVPILSSLHMLKKQSKSKIMRTIMTQVISDVENGQYLATALGKFKNIFGELTINIIAIGEISGNLSNNLSHLAVTLKKQQVLRRKVISASVYPVFIIIATLAITIMLTVFFFPKLIPIFKSVNYDLPWPTKFLIFTSTLMRVHGWLMLIGLIGVIIGATVLLRIKKVRLWRDKICVFLPVLKMPIVIYNATNMCRTMGLLLNSGVGVAQAFHITSNTTPNLVYKIELQRLSDNVTKGEKISTIVSQAEKLFPTMMGQMIVVGESTGKLSDIFLYLADVYDEEMDELTKNTSTTIEPLLLIFMGVLVGFIAISIITPIYGITQNLTPK